MKTGGIRRERKHFSFSCATHHILIFAGHVHPMPTYHTSALKNKSQGHQPKGRMTIILLHAGYTSLPQKANTKSACLINWTQFDEFFPANLHQYAQAETSLRQYSCRAYRSFSSPQTSVR